MRREQRKRGYATNVLHNEAAGEDPMQCKFVFLLLVSIQSSAEKAGQAGPLPLHVTVFVTMPLATARKDTFTAKKKDQDHNHGITQSLWEQPELLQWQCQGLKHC